MIPILPLEVTQAEVLLNRYDAVVLDVDARTSVRANTIKIINGTPGSSPSKPEMLKDNDHWQYPLAYIYVAAGVTSIGQENITNVLVHLSVHLLQHHWRKWILTPLLLSGKHSGMFG